MLAHYATSLLWSFPCTVAIKCFTQAHCSLHQGIVLFSFCIKTNSCSITLTKELILGLKRWLSSLQNLNKHIFQFLKICDFPGEWERKSICHVDAIKVPALRNCHHFSEHIKSDISEEWCSGNTKSSQKACSKNLLIMEIRYVKDWGTAHFFKVRFHRKATQMYKVLVEHLVI